MKGKNYIGLPLQQSKTPGVLKQPVKMPKDAAPLKDAAPPPALARAPAATDNKSNAAADDKQSDEKQKEKLEKEKRPKEIKPKVMKLGAKEVTLFSFPFMVFHLGIDIQ
ncbi:unnamed protein product [Gongylonema pulchrum]|uniref:60S ribosomal protein L7a n=1 Tax=Gongylonema pulchrum TaxID=637853 RepID=A0A183DEW1_9BILA|nr:unnamed protein product [Gongylonema pulchrum]